MPAPTPAPAWLQQSGPDALLHIKAVPGASRDQIAGPLGDRLKIRIAAPPEAGKANKAIVALLVKALALKPRDIAIESGETSHEKTVRIRNSHIQPILAKLAEP